MIKTIVTTLDNLPMLKEQVPILKADYLIDEIVIVNNGSRDGTKEWLLEQNGLTVVNRENCGAGPGRNSGLDAAGEADYYLMLDGGIRPLHGGASRMLEYLERRHEADVIGVEIPCFELDGEKAWRRWPEPIKDGDTYCHKRLSHTAYCLARRRAFDGIRFCEEGPFGRAGWGADDDEMMYQWLDKGIVLYVVVGVHPYRRASGSFQRLHEETGVYPTQYGSVFEERLVWLQHHYPHHEPGDQWGEPWLTVVIVVDGIEKTARLIKEAHDTLRQRRFEDPWGAYPNPYSIVAWGDDPEWLKWAEPRHLRRHHGDAIVVNNETVRRSPEDIWTGNFRLWTKAGWRAAIRPGAYYYGLVRTRGELLGLIDVYSQRYPPQPTKRPPEQRVEIAMEEQW